MDTAVILIFSMFGLSVIVVFCDDCDSALSVEVCDVIEPRQTFRQSPELLRLTNRVELRVRR